MFSVFGRLEMVLLKLLVGSVFFCGEKLHAQAMSGVCSCDVGQWFYCGCRSRRWLRGTATLARPLTPLTSSRRLRLGCNILAPPGPM